MVTRHQLKLILYKPSEHGILKLDPNFVVQILCFHEILKRCASVYGFACSKETSWAS